MTIFEPGTLIVSLLGFVLMFLIIKRVAFKPLASMMEQRRTYIERQITEAEGNRNQAEGILAEQRALLEKARGDAQELLDASRVRAENQAKSIIQDAQAEAQRQLDEARKLIERERAEATSEILSQVSAITVELTTKLLRNHVSPVVHEEMLTEAEKRLGELVC